MRIESIKMHNFRIYKDIEINFNKKNEDMQIIIGKNGMGKTTFLNAINWCLYNDEPHAYSKETSLPVLNLSTLDDPEKKIEVYVEIIISSNEGNELKYKRTETYVNGNVYSNELIVKEKLNNGETRIHDGEEADYMVDRFVPLTIREFFFFDGEQLDTYFTSQKSDNIKHNIFILSHIDILESMLKHLSKKSSDLRNEASNLDPNLSEINKELQSYMDAVQILQKEEEELNNEITLGKTQKNKLDTDLKGIPDLDKVNEQLKIDKKTRDELKSKIENKKNQIRELNFNSAAPIFLTEAINYTLKRLDDEKDDLPPSIDEEEIRKSLSNKKCTSCNQILTDDAISYMNSILTEYKLSSKESKILLKVSSQLETYTDTIDNYNKIIYEKIDDLKTLNKSLNDVLESITNAEKQFLGYSNEKIVNKFRLLKKLDNELENNLVKLGRKQTEINEDNLKIEKLKDQLNQCQEDDEKTKILLQKNDLCTKSEEIVVNTKNQIMNDTRSSIESFTKKTFFDLIWKKETYSDIKIDDSYNLELIHNKTNQNSIGSASAAERELLALAFTLGIHSISGFNSPLLIDTPLARVSDDHRVNFANVLLEISKEKEIILIVTPDEFSENIKPIFEESPKYEIELTDKEYIATIKEVV